MEICMQTLLLSLLLNLVLSVGNAMLPIEDLMVDGGCIATTDGRRLFCKIIYIYLHGDYSVIDDRIIFCIYFILLTTHVCTSYDTSNRARAYARSIEYLI
jgi:hypothetical protein